MSSFLPSTDNPQPLPVLSINECRVLGVLVEKAKTTPDAYPLSLNALTVGCNQKSNRDPLLDLNDLDVEEALAKCQKKGLAFKIVGGRVERWKHNLYEAWRANKVELAVLGELLLRGAQTEGELRTRASRMEPIADLDALRVVLKPLADRGLVVYLTPPGRRGTTLTHGFSSPNEIEKLRSRHFDDARAEEPPALTPVVASPPPVPVPEFEGEIAELRNEVAALKNQVAELQNAMTGLKAELVSLRAALGG
jgi:uncharacterized protein YceH (UPF0502 family)